MAFDWNYAASNTVEKATSSTEPMTFDRAKSKSLGNKEENDKQEQGVSKQLENWKAKKINGKNNKPSPSNWFYKDVNGNWSVSWRISNKPVFFNDACKQAGGWLPIKGDDVEGALNALKDEILSGKHDDALIDAYDRKPKPKPKRKKKEEATEEAE